MTASVRHTVRIPNFRTDSLPHRSVISRLSGYYEATDSTQPCWTSSPIPTAFFLTGDRLSGLSRSVRNTTADRFRHPPVVIRVRLVGRFAFLKEGDSCTSIVTSAVTLNIMCILKIGFPLVLTHDDGFTCCGFLNVALSVLRSPTRTTRFRSYRLVRLGLAPRNTLL